MQRKVDESLLPPELRRKPPPREPSKTEPPKLKPAEGPEPITFRVLPTPLPGGAGLGLYVTF